MRPTNKNGILLPDNTYTCHVNEKNICKFWTDVVNECIYLNKKVKIKKNDIFFTGANTGEEKHNLRKKFSEVEGSENFPLDVKLKQPRISVCDFAKHKYLLNLPGNQPWSYRFKYLFLTKSLVINLCLKQQYDPKDIPNGQYVTIFDQLFEEGVDYINIDFLWKEYDEKHNEKEFDKTIKKLEEIYNYFEEHPDKYKKITENGYKKVMKITERMIYTTIYLTMKYYHDKIKKIMVLE